MNSIDDERVERFRRRTAGTDHHVLARNLTAGVYGPPGSVRYRVAEQALQERGAAQVAFLPVASRDDALSLDQRLRQAHTAALRATWIAALALLVALFGIARSLNP